MTSIFGQISIIRYFRNLLFSKIDYGSLQYELRIKIHTLIYVFMAKNNKFSDFRLYFTFYLLTIFLQQRFLPDYVTG